MNADLHLHTVHSDGSWTPEQLVEAALEHDLKVIAITDHDTVEAVEAARNAAAGRLEVIAGIEINTVLDDAVCGFLDIHILGYFVDTTSGALARVREKQQNARLQLVDDAVAKCKSLGIPLSHELVAEFAGCGSIGRPHIARAIVKAGGAADVAEAFERFMTRTSPDYIPRAAVSPADAIAAIREAGGISSIAHPGKNPEMPRIIGDLREQGLQGIECYHRSHTTPELVKQYLHLAATNDMVVTGGSDCHGPNDGYPAAIGSVKVPLHVVQELKQAAGLAISR